MSTSLIPVYYEKNLCGSISVAEYMNQKRYDGHSMVELMSLKKEQLRNLYVSMDETAAKYYPKCAGMTKSSLLWSVLLSYWAKQGRIEWEFWALNEIHDVYLSK